MRVLTVRQPWAGLIALGIKDVENRSWTPSLEPGERVAIYAGQGFDDVPLPVRVRRAVREDPLLDARGLIIATVKLVAVTQDSKSRWAIPGLYHWVLADPELGPARHGPRSAGPVGVR